MNQSIKRIGIRGLLISIILIIISCAAYTSHAAEGVDLSFEKGYAAPGETITVTCAEGQSLDGLSFRWTLDGKEVNNNGKSFSFSNSDVEKLAKVEAYSGSGKVGEAYMLCSNLPVVYLNTENGQQVTSKEEYINGDIRVEGSKDFPGTYYDGATEVKGHGNSTWKWFPKKPFKLKLDKSTDLCDMGKNKHWLLVANYLDESCMRNKLSGRIAEILGGEKLDCVWVDVVLNGEHQGNYQLYEQARISEDRVNITDWEDEGESAAKKIAKGIAKDRAKAQGLTDEEKTALEDKIKDDLKTQMTETDMSWMSTGKVTYEGTEYEVADYYELPEANNGGFLFEMEFLMDEATCFYTNREVPIMVKKPEFLLTDPATLDNAKRVVQEFEDVIYATDKNANGKCLKDVCYEDTLISYWLTTELMFNEAGSRSTFFYNDVNDKLRFGPVWDFDSSSNSIVPFSDYSSKGWYYPGRWWFDAAVRDPYFAVKTKELYKEKYPELMNLISNEDELAQWYSYIHDSAVKNNDLWPYSRGFDGDYQSLRQWIKDRTDWINTQFTSDDKAVTSMGSTLSGNIQLYASGDCYVKGSGKNFHATKAEGGKVIVNGTVAGGYPTAAIYVNGRYITDAAVENGTFSYEIDQALLDEELGTKNVVTVWVKDGNGTLCEMQYLTITCHDTDTDLVKVTFNEYSADRTVTYDVPAGTKIFVPDSVDSHTSKDFKGWKNDADGSVVQFGDLITINGDTSFRATFEPCGDGVDHSWKKTDSGFVCEKCGYSKVDDGQYIDIESCVFEQDTRYGTKYKAISVHPVITVSYAGIPLTEGVEYTISYKNSVNAGFATYTIKGNKSAGFNGTAELTYRINPRDISENYVRKLLEKSQYEYTGEEIRPQAAMKLGFNGEITEECVEGKDFTVEYRSNVALGTGTVVFTGKGNYTGTFEKTFEIVPINKPSKPAKVLADCSEVVMGWTGSEHADGYYVYRSDSADGTYKRIKTLNTNTTEYADKTVVPGKSYYYKVCAYRNIDGTTYTSEKTSAAKGAAKVMSISGVKAEKNTYKSIKVSWNATPGATGYKVYRAAKKSGTYKLINTTDSVKSFKDSTVTPGKTYYYKVRSIKKIGEKTYQSSQSSAVKQTAAPKALSGVKATNIKTKTSKISWTKASNVTGYKVYRATKKTGTYKLVKTIKKSSTVSYKDTKKTKGKTYYYKIRAYKVYKGKTIYGAYSDVYSVKITK